VGVEEESVIQNLIELANEVGLEDVNDDDAEESLQSRGERLSNDKLRELAEQRIQSESEAFDAEFLSNSITAIMQIMDQFIDNDPDWERSNKAKRGVLYMKSCYQELFHEKIQSTLDVYIKTKPRFA
jgi:hypothetical protein